MFRFSQWRRAAASFFPRWAGRRGILEDLHDAVRGPRAPAAVLKDLRSRFSHFTALLERNNAVLRTMSGLEEKTKGEFLFDVNFLRAGLEATRSGVRGMIEDMVALGGADYAVLRGRLARVEREAEAALSGTRPVGEDAYVLPLEEAAAKRAWSVGGKAAGLGEMKSAGLPVPEGFAVSAWAYKRFLDANGLGEILTERLRALDVKDLEDLGRASREIQKLVAESPVPDDLGAELDRAAASLAERAPSGSFALRSSALAEDGALSFAGQYATFLNIRPGEIRRRYADLAASLFSPNAIYYFLSHALPESGLAMGAAAVAMVDSRASGVVYTRDPLRPEDDALLVTAVLGQGRLLVDGTLTPDLFRVTRSGFAVASSEIADKPVRLVMDPAGGMRSEEVPEGERRAPSIAPETVRELAQLCAGLEERGGGPRDVEWAMDREGRLRLLQDRPLRVFPRPARLPEADVLGLTVLAAGGITVCPGAASGTVFHVRSPAELPKVPKGSVLFAERPFPEISAAAGLLSAVITRRGAIACHMATLVREFGIPAIVLKEGGLEPGRLVTVDAGAGTVYDGAQPSLVKARSLDRDSLEEEAVIAQAKRLLRTVSPLNLPHPADPGFTPAACRTFHDLTRFIHQRAMEEMFSSGRGMGAVDLGMRLKSSIPLPVSVLCVDPALAREYADYGSIDQDRLPCEPMRAFWDGVVEEGWPKPSRVELKGLASVVGTHLAGGAARAGFQERSFALIGREYMLLSLKMGYHFTTVEAVCSAEAGKNHIRMQFKHGGASKDRRLRRIRLLEDIFGRMGFESSARGDFIEARFDYGERGEVRGKLRLLGRLTILTKQLDMALGSDAVLRWYIEDFTARLGLRSEEGR